VLVVAQAIPLALAPSFDVQLELVADRAAMHLIPAAFLLCFGIEGLIASAGGRPLAGASR
jgi:hypothetical protein